MWGWVNTYRYIFSGMNIHLPAILGFTRYQGFDPSPCHFPFEMIFDLFAFQSVPICSNHAAGSHKSSPGFHRESLAECFMIGESPRSNARRRNPQIIANKKLKRTRNISNLSSRWTMFIHFHLKMIVFFPMKTAEKHPDHSSFAKDLLRWSYIFPMNIYITHPSKKTISSIEIRSYT